MDIVKECSVVLERLGESTSHLGAKDVKKCSDVLERLGESTSHLGAKDVKKCSDVLERLGESTSHRNENHGVERKEKTQSGTGIGMRLRPSTRQSSTSSIRAGKLQRTAMMVTQGSARRRGRARAIRTKKESTSTAPATGQRSESVLRFLRVFNKSVSVLVRTGVESDQMFPADEKSVLDRWLQLGEETQATYLELLGLTSRSWFRPGNVRAAANAAKHFVDLESADFVSSVVADSEWKQVVPLLRIDELLKMGEGLGITFGGRKTKLAYVLAIVRFGESGAKNAATLRDSLRLALGGCVRLLTAPRIVLERALLLLAAWLPTPRDGNRLRAVRTLVLHRDDDDGKLLQREERSMFRSRRQALEWEAVARARTELEAAVKDGKWRAVEGIAQDLLQRLKNHPREQDASASSSPEDSATGYGDSGTMVAAERALGDALSDALTAAVKALKSVTPALTAEIVLALIEQAAYDPEKRADWAVTYSLLPSDAQKKISDESILAGELEDGRLQAAHRAAVEARVQAVIGVGEPSEASDWLTSMLRDPLPPPQTVVIKATGLHGAPGLKRVYVHRTGGAGGDKAMLSVEGKVMAHFAKNGEYPQGVDDEGETLVSLVVLALWDVVYGAAEVADDHVQVWGSACQDRPLDWGTARFWKGRRLSLQRRLEVMERMDAADLADELLRARQEHGGTRSLVRWALLRELDLGVLLNCLTVPVFVAISRRILWDFSAFRKGFPDLFLWNSELKKSVFVEVKGPKDILSMPQAMWLNYLQQHGAATLLAKVKS